MTDGTELSRRKTLAGLATIGVAGAGAGLGTSALFSDDESFDDNVVTAGELNLQVTANVHDKNAPLDMVEIAGDSEAENTADGTAVTITASDMQPGDWFLVGWDLVVCDNPAYVRVTSAADAYTSEEGDNPESESDSDPPGDLGGSLLTTIWHTYSPGDADTRSDLADLDPTTNQDDAELGGYETPDADGVTSSGAHYTSLDEAHETYKSGVTLADPSAGEPLAVGCEDDAVTYYQLFELPLEAGNDIQGDSVTFTLQFDAEQTRNNPNPFE